MRPESSAGTDRFVLLPRLHVDRAVLADLLDWAEPRGLATEQAIQLALCVFNQHRGEWLGPEDGTVTAAALLAPAEPAGGALRHGP
jgi:hypothetical protein